MKRPITARRLKMVIIGILAAFPSATTLVPLATAHAATTTLQPTAKVSFTFDDGLTSAFTKAAPTLATYGYTGTDYVISGCVGTTGTCAADPSAAYMGWDQVTQLQDTYHWEIGSHSVTHPLMTKITAAQLDTELSGSKQALQAHGINPTAFATPYGDYNPAVQAAIAKYYTSHRGFADQEYGNDWPYNDYLLYVKQVQAGVSVAQVKTYIDQAKQNKQWLVLVFHDIADVPSTDPQDYQYGTSDLAQIAAYVQAQNLPVVNVSSGLVTSANASDNLLAANSSFDNGIANGWTTDSATNIKKDTALHGSVPSPQNSIAFTSNASKSVHLFSPKVTVSSATTYMLKTYLNLPTIKNNEVVFYIDEYDSAGKWISGQYKVGEPNVSVENINFSYKPSSANVKSASYQVAIGAGTGVKGYIDNVQWFPTN